jgi:N-methylhydantoinase B
MTTTGVDPITLNIVGKSLQAIAREMAANMRRASYSSVVREARDFSVGILDASGNVVAQAEMIPMQTGGITEAFKPVRQRFDFATLTPDDAFIMNDPFTGGQHLQDIFLFTPVFVNKELVGFAASVAHHVEVGGGMPGLNAAATEFYQEGLRMPASRFSRARDWDGGFVETFIRANVRVPEKVIGQQHRRPPHQRAGRALRRRDTSGRYVRPAGLRRTPHPRRRPSHPERRLLRRG